MAKHILFLLGIAALAGCQGVLSGAVKLDPPTHTDQALPGAYRYKRYLPEGHAQARQRWPMIIFLHGSGERGDDIAAVTKHGPPMMAEAGHRFNFVIYSPQCPSGGRWSPKKIMKLLEHAIRHDRADSNRIYLTGLSMGGYGTWATVAEFSDRFAAIAPICGGGDPATAPKFKHVPTWVFHGDQDKAVPIARSRAMVDAIKKIGGNVQFTVYPGIGHNSWTATYANPKLYAWFLAHRRQP